MAEKTKEKQTKSVPEKVEPKAKAQKKGTAPTKKKASFRLNAPEATMVCLAGSFNEWDPSVRPLRRDAKGAWMTTVTLAPGIYEYRFIVDGEWCDDPDASERRANEHGTQNCIIRIGD